MFANRSRIRPPVGPLIVVICSIASLMLVATSCAAAPDEDLLGSRSGYPSGSTMAQTFQQPYMVGSFSAMDQFVPSCTLPPSPEPFVLKKAASEPVFRYRFDGKSFSLDDYMQRQRTTAVLVLKDGEIVAERYNYQRTADMRMLSNSMAKTIVGLALVKARDDGLIRSFDDTAATYVPELAGTLYGETRILNLLRMASGARYVEDYSSNDDRARFNAARRRAGLISALKTVTERADAEGTKFNYAGAQTEVLGLVLRRVSGKSLCAYVAETLWQPLGAESKATWLLNAFDGTETAQGGFNATVRDYARLGSMMANDGLVQGRTVMSKAQLLDMTDPVRQPAAFRPGSMLYKGSTYQGYGLQTWLLPGSHRRFALEGIHGQIIFVDPELKLVVVHMAVGKDASGDASGNHMEAERDALLRGIVARYGRW